jgi:hypothetical protein
VARNKVPSEVDRWELTELELHSAVWFYGKCGVTAGTGSTSGSRGEPDGSVAVGAGDGVVCVLVTVAKMLASYWLSLAG